MHIKNIKVGIVILFTIVFSLSQKTVAAIVDITAPDGIASSYYGTDPRVGIGESGEVTAGSSAIATYDHRAIAIDTVNQRLLVVSGFNPRAPSVDGFEVGDIFIDSNNSINHPSRISGANGYFPYSNPGFEAVIDIKGSSGASLLSYEIRMLSTNSIVETSYFASNSPADPYRSIKSDADTYVSSGSYEVQIMSDSQVLNLLGINIGTNGGNNYVSFFDLKPLNVPGLFKGFPMIFQYGEGCGNDLIKTYEYTLPLSVSCVPEPTGPLSIALMLLTGFTLRSRRK